LEEEMEEISLKDEEHGSTSHQSIRHVEEEDYVII